MSNEFNIPELNGILVDHSVRARSTMSGAAHDVLDNEDLIRCIFSWLDKSTLARAARVSKALFTPAVRELWSSVGMRTLGLSSAFVPHDQRMTFMMAESPASSALRAAIREAYKNRGKLYTPFIRCLTASTHETLPLRELCRAALFAPLFPNLRSLDILCSGQTFPVGQLPLVPSLRGFSIRLSTDDGDRNSRYLTHIVRPSSTASYGDIDYLTHLFDTLSTETPCLTSLRVTGCSYRNMRSLEWLMTCIERFPLLETVWLDIVARSIRPMSRFAQMKELRELTIDVPATNPALRTSGLDDLDTAIMTHPNLWDSILTPLFPRLEVLELVCSHTVAFVTWLLTRITSSSLHRLRITPQFGSSVDDVGSMMTSVLSVGSRLKVLEIVAKGQVPAVFWTTLPLLRDLNVRRFGLIIDDVQQADCDWEGQLISIADSFPNIEDLAYDIGPNIDVGTNTWTRLSSLLLLAKACPNLKKLYIGGLTCENQWLEHHTNSINSTLNTLSTRRCDIEPLHLAKFVIAVWPAAQVRHLVGEELVVDPKVNTILEGMAYVRRLDGGQERVAI